MALQTRVAVTTFLNIARNERVIETASLLKINQASSKDTAVSLAQQRKSACPLRGDWLAGENEY
jgi:hypothetical protein